MSLSQTCCNWDIAIDIVTLQAAVQDIEVIDLDIVQDIEANDKDIVTEVNDKVVVPEVNDIAIDMPVE